MNEIGILKKKYVVLFLSLAGAETSRGVVCADKRRTCDGRDREIESVGRGKTGIHGFL